MAYGAADASGDEIYAMIAEKVRDRIQLMSLSKTNDADIAAEFVVAMLKGGMRVLHGMTLRERH